MARGEDQHSIEHEPALMGLDPQTPRDVSESRADRVLDKAKATDDAYLHSVHDELAILPGDHDNHTLIDRDFACNHCGYNLRMRKVGEPCPECNQVQFERPSPKDRLGFAHWLGGRIAQTSVAKTWWVTLLIVATGGFLAVVGVFIKPAGGFGGLISIAFWGPTVEEVLKIALIAIIIERRPYLFRSRAQIMIAAAGCGLTFAAIENILYLFVYIPNPPVWLVYWRWTVCVALHVGCTLVAGYGASLVWRKTLSELRRHPIPIDLRFLILAIAIHGTYNATVTVLELTGAWF